MRGDLQGFGPFRLDGVLGEGERAVVYRARREGDGEVTAPSALKLMRPAAADDPEERAAFLARGQAAAHLQGPAIVAIEETGEIDGQPFVRRRLVDGVDLGALFPKRGGKARLSDSVGAHVVTGLLSALEAAARSNPPRVHGRVEPGNVLIDTDGDVWLASFGTEGDPRADFLGLARVAQRLCREWTPEVDGWLDRLQDGEGSFGDVAEARAAFPLSTTVDGRKSLARAVKRVLKRREREREEAAREADQAAREADETAREVAGRLGTRRPRAPAPAARRDDHEAALRQARVVGLIAASVVLAALLLEILEFGG